MEIFLTYVKVFAVGGIVCSVGQLLINKTNMTSARILVLYMLLGVVLEISGAFTPMKDFAGSGVTIPIMGFGSSLTKGALEGVAQFGLLGALTGGLSAVAAGLTTVIVCGFVFGLISRSRSKKM
ncbi:MAG: SpoVA/SpoVAEb family sporulation membrane protein [Clostridia bacterium]